MFYNKDRRKLAQFVSTSMERRKEKPYMIEAVVMAIMSGRYEDDIYQAELVEKCLKRGKPTTKTNLELVIQAKSYWDEQLDRQKLKPVKKPKKKRPRSIIKKGLRKK